MRDSNNNRSHTSNVSFTYSTEKIVQAVAVILQTRKDRRMNYFRLLKLLYIADRESLKEAGRPIAGSRPVAMRLGMLDGYVYDLIKKPELDATWSKYIEKDGWNIVLKTLPGDLELSDREVEKLRSVAKRYRNLKNNDVALKTHFPEWHKRFPGQNKKVVDGSLEDMIDGVERTADKQAIMDEARQKAIFDKMFGR